MNNIIGWKIKNLRTRLKIHQKNLCCDILNRSVLSKIENGKVTPSIYQLSYIAKELGVNINYFLENEVNDREDIKAIDNELNTLYAENRYYEIIKNFESCKNNYNSEFYNYFYIGHAYYNMEFYNEALKVLRKYVSKCNKQPDELLKKHILDLAFALNTLCKLMLKNSNYKKAMTYLFLAKDYLEHYEKENSKIYFILLNNIGSVYGFMNDYSKIVCILQPFIDNIKDFGYLKIIPSIHLSLNIAYYNLGDYEKSIEHIKKAIFFYNYTERKEHAYGCYLNYINALRYCKLYDEAFNILEQYKLEYPEKKEHDFLIQQMVLLFNKNKYIDFLELVPKLKLNQLSKLNKYGYYFMMGHISFLQKQYIQAEGFLLKCEKYFIIRNFNLDLALIYKDLYVITNNTEYKNKLHYLKKIKGKKNIMVS